MKAAAADLQGKASAARKGGGVYAPDAEHFLSVDDCGFHASAAGDDRKVLHGAFQMVLIDLPLIIASFWSITAFYLYAQRELYPKTWWKSIAFMPMLMAGGRCADRKQFKGRHRGLPGIKSSFARTAKYALGTQKVKIQPTAYRRRSGWLPYIELGDRDIFRVHDQFRDRNAKFLRHSVPGAIVCGYYWAGFTTLYEEYRASCDGNVPRNCSGAAASLPFSAP